MAKSKTSSELVASTEPPHAPLSLREAPRVLQTIQDVWRGVGTDGTWRGALPQLEHIDEAEVPVFIANARAVLARPATDREIKSALAVLQAGLKWPGPEVIHNKAAFLTLMHESLKTRAFAAAVIEQGVRAATERCDWMPSIRELVGLCAAAQREIEAGLLFIEAPTEVRSALTYGILYLGDTREDAAAELRRRAPHWRRQLS